MKLYRKLAIIGFVVGTLAFAATPVRAATSSTSLGTGPLPSWNDTAPKKDIVGFVERVTKEGSPDFVPMSERIAVFDNDGTLRAEQPMYFQGLFLIDRVKSLTKGWTMVDMKKDWKRVFPFEEAK